MMRNQHEADILGQFHSESFGSLDYLRFFRRSHPDHEVRASAFGRHLHEVSIADVLRMSTK